MLPAVIFSSLAALATAAGGLMAMRIRDKRHLVLALVGGIIIGIVAFDLIPESMELSDLEFFGLPAPMVLFVAGFLSFHVLEKVFDIHHASSDHYKKHEHPVAAASLLAASAMVGHSLLDGFSIGVSLTAGSGAAAAVVIAVVAHDFADGFNTYTIGSMGGSRRRGVILLTLGALAPVVGATAGTAFQMDPTVASLYLAYFAGFILYIATSHILPEAHADHSSRAALAATIGGVVVIGAVL